MDEIHKISHCYDLKLNSVNLTQSVLFSWGVVFHIWKKSRLKYFAVSEDAAHNLRKCLKWWPSCIVGNVDTRLFSKRNRKAWNKRQYLRFYCIDFDLFSIRIQIVVQYEASGLLYKTWRLRYPQCNLATEWHHWRQCIRLHAASSGVKTGVTLWVIFVSAWQKCVPCSEEMDDLCC